MEQVRDGELRDSVRRRTLSGSNKVFKDSFGPIAQPLAPCRSEAILDSLVAGRQAGTPIGAVSIGGKNSIWIPLEQLPAVPLRFRTVVAKERIDRNLEPGSGMAGHDAALTQWGGSGQLRPCLRCLDFFQDAVQFFHVRRLVEERIEPRSKSP